MERALKGLTASCHARLLIGIPLALATWIGLPAQQASALQDSSSGSGLETAPEEPLESPDFASPLAIGSCERTIRATVVAIDQSIFFNRLMVFLPTGMIYALEHDLDQLSQSPRLRPGKRPRPIVLRMNVGDCLAVRFRNLLRPQPVNQEQPATRSASMYIDGLPLVGSILSSGSNVGANPSSLIPPGGEATYIWYGAKEGPFLVHSAGAMTGGEGDGGQPDHGLFGAVIVEPRGSVWYRSQITAEEMDLSTTFIDPDGFRRINYNAVYPPDHPDPRRRGKPVLKILDGDLSIFHSDLYAIVANIPPGTYPDVPAAAPDNNGIDRNRNEPFRELTVFYHDENALAQAFPILEDPDLFFVKSIVDNMAINYGTGGVGAEVISYGADQIVGNSAHIPAGMAARCNDCVFEEAFLSSWAVGDPAQIVRRRSPEPTAPLEEFLYPDDPSNVFHAYLNDHTKFRIIHAGVKEHHIHHQHAHQWLHLQNEQSSNYLDSQAIGPGSAFTLDIAYNGAGNRNKTIGDSIFHCHFYPHFAQGMWGLYRVHDVFEDGRNVLPDAESERGSPVPGVVPLPGMPMNPPPSPENLGYPYFLPGNKGHRPPHPPLDFFVDENGRTHDGGLPRHVVVGGVVLDGVNGVFDREHLELDAQQLPEQGTPEEIATMAYHAQRLHHTKTPEGNPAILVTNGLPPISGAPFADPCVDDNGQPIETLRKVFGVAHQLPKIFFNKKKWHFDQWRMISLWGDFADLHTPGSTTPPEPFFIRAHSGDCINFYHTNLIPRVYEEDNFQIFTVTDIIGQHIHLVKFDVTASDGAGNGWNYEDGTFAPGEVEERIRAINVLGGIRTYPPPPPGQRPPREELRITPHPFFGVPGAQTTVQRWWADPILMSSNQGRELRMVFTHDHFGPSTHQQVGLYAGLVIEPPGSLWRNSETGEQLGGRFDGGPTSWRADVITTNVRDTYREFLIEFQDFNLAYWGTQPVNPPDREEVCLPFLVEANPLLRPEGISNEDPGTMSVNYRNEPIALRIRNPQSNQQAPGVAGDLAHAYRSNVTRADPDFNVQPNFYRPLTNDVRPGDPFTPLLRAYEGDRVKVRMLMGAHEEGHNFTIHGLKWRQGPDDPNSSWRNSQMNGISEFFDFEVGLLPEVGPDGRGTADYLYQPSAAVDGQWNGMWGILREYVGVRNDLLPLPNNPDGQLSRQFNVGAFEDTEESIPNDPFFRSICPRGAPRRNYDVTAVRAIDVLSEGTLIYNKGRFSNDPTVPGDPNTFIHDPTALMYVLTSDLIPGPNGPRLRDEAPREPLILRANAGDCVRVKLRNGFRAAPFDLVGFNHLPMIVERFNANQIVPSADVGLHAQLLQFNIRRHNGVTVGFNPISTVSLTDSRTYEWYAGSIDVRDDGTVVARPIEFGATGLLPADLMKHSNKGLVGALIIEPRGSTWTLPDSRTRAMADVYFSGTNFRESVVVFQDDVNLRHFPGVLPPPPPPDPG